MGGEYRPMWRWWSYRLWWQGPRTEQLYLAAGSVLRCILICRATRHLVNIDDLISNTIKSYIWCSLSLIPFLLYAELMVEVMEGIEEEVKVRGELMKDLQFTDDQVIC